LRTSKLLFVCLRINKTVNLGEFVSHYSRLSFVLNICTKLALYLQFIVHFVGIVHIFMFSLILYNRYSRFCELMLKPLQFQAKIREVQVADVSLSEADPLSEWHPLSESYILSLAKRDFRRWNVQVAFKTLKLAKTKRELEKQSQGRSWSNKNWATKRV